MTVSVTGSTTTCARPGLHRIVHRQQSASAGTPVYTPTPGRSIERIDNKGNLVRFQRCSSSRLIRDPIYTEDLAAATTATMYIAALLLFYALVFTIFPQIMKTEIMAASQSQVSCKNGNYGGVFWPSTRMTPVNTPELQQQY